MWSDLRQIKMSLKQMVGHSKLLYFCIIIYAFLILEMLRICRQSLPSHLVPYDFFNMKAFPITVNGKIDKKALIEDYQREKKEKYSNVQGNLATILSKVWQDILKVSPHPKDKFLDLGGDSILAVKLSQQIEETSRKVFPDLIDRILSSTFEEVTDYLLNFKSFSKSLKRDVNEEPLTGNAMKKWV